MINDYEGNLNDNGWKLARDWKLGDLVANPGEHDRQDRFASDVHAFVAAGQPDGRAHAGIARMPDNGSWSNGLSPIGKDGHESTPPDYGFAQGIQAFMKAGQTAGEGFSSGKVNFPTGANGQGQENGTKVDATDSLTGQPTDAMSSASRATIASEGSRQSPENGQGIVRNQGRDSGERQQAGQTLYAWNYATEYGTSGDGLHQSMRDIEATTDSVFNQITGRDATVTYTTNGAHAPNSQHYSGNAVDIRTRDMTPSQIQSATERLRNELGPNYRIMNEGDHIHIQRERARG